MTILVALLLSLSAHAGWEQTPVNSFDLPAPPAEGSARERADFRKLHQYQDRRTDEDCRVAATQERPTPQTLFGGHDGVLTADEVESVEPLLTRAFRFSSRVAGYFKDRYDRPRPFNIDETLEPCVHRPGGSKAYPSSHAVMGVVGACVLAEIHRDSADELTAHGKRVGELRVIAGVHHPSDVEAGWMLGEAICEMLLSDAGFRRELRAVQ